MHEVVEVLQRERRRDIALMTVALMRQGTVVPLDEGIAVNAALLGLAYRLPTADSIILATAQAHEALLWTSDKHFSGIPGVRCLPKRRGGGTMRTTIVIDERRGRRLSLRDRQGA